MAPGFPGETASCLPVMLHRDLTPLSSKKMFVASQDSLGNHISVFNFGNPAAPVFIRDWALHGQQPGGVIPPHFTAVPSILPIWLLRSTWGPRRCSGNTPNPRAVGGFVLPAMRPNGGNACNADLQCLLLPFNQPPDYP